MSRTTSPWWLRLSLWFAATRLGTWVLSRTLPRVDRVLSSVSGGRLSIARLLSALGAPVVELTTVGTKTGKRRSVPVLGFRDGRKWVVVASNWGRDRQPAWYHNLRARPDVELSFGGETEQYVASEVTGAKRAAYWSRLEALNPGLEAYQERSGDRDIPVVVLTPKPMAQARTAPGGRVSATQ